MPRTVLGLGQVVGNYKITAKLGEGGMGIVFLAEHPVIGKRVALKVIHPELARNPEVVSRFIMEAKSVNQIGHEHIVDIGDFGSKSSEEFYFIMEYLQGESLADRLKREVSLSQARALHIGAQIADALGASHSHGIIHRDLKPENIFLITRRGDPDFVKVLDFGLAKLTQVAERVTHKTRAGSVMGTPYYMSPEQGEGKIEIDHRADIYSLGVLLFEMLTGKVPFGGEGYGEIIVKHITHQAPSARRINPAISAAVEMILFRALTKDRDHRFQTMEDFRKALLNPEAYLAGAPSVTMPAEVTGVTRLAAPMARQDMPLSTLGHRFSGASDDDSGVVDRITPPGPSSTFRHAVGQMEQAISLKPKSQRKMVLGILGGAVAAILTLSVVGRAMKESDRSRSARFEAATRTLHEIEKTPATVRLNFTSDPDGAIVSRESDGSELGMTPLSIEVAYSNSPEKFVLRKVGFEDKMLFVVPNLPVPLFAALQPESRTSEGEPGTAARRSKAAARKVAKLESRVEPENKPGAPHKAEHNPAPLDGDAVLEPDFK
ncbi:MAG TPA: serine/threonine-protein kinase [Polyangia bacterium]